MAAAAPLLGKIALNLAIGVAASAFSAALRPSAAQPTSHQSGTEAIRPEQSLEIGGDNIAVSAVVGQYPVDGQVIYVNQFGTDEAFTQLVVMIGHGEHTSFEGFKCEGEFTALSGSNSDARGKVVEAYRNAVGDPCMWIKTYTGAAGQTADPELVARAVPSGRWTVNHTLTGVCYHVITLKTGEPGIFDSRLPKMQYIWRGLKFYDWRLDGTQPGGDGLHRFDDPSTWEWTDNPIVIRWNFRRGYWINGVKIFGMGLPQIFNDLDYYTAAANICDEELTDPDTETVYHRYAYSALIADSDEHLKVLTDLDEAICGRSFARGGVDAPVPGQALMSVMTLTDQDRIDGTPVSADKYGAVSEKSTRWHGRFIDAARDYVPSPYTPRTNDTLEGKIGRYSIEFNQPWETLMERAQMRAEIRKRREQFPAVRRETFLPKALELELGDLVTRDCEWGEMPMRVVEIEDLPGKIGVTITLAEWDNAIVPDSEESFVEIIDDQGVFANAPVNTITVAGLDHVLVQQVSEGGSQAPYVKFIWEGITDPAVIQVMVRLWPDSGTEAADAQDFFADSRLQSFKLAGPLAPETLYRYKAIPIRNDLLTCAFTSEGTFTTGELIVGEANLAPILSTLRNQLLLEVRDIRERLQQVEASQSEQVVKINNDLVKKFGDASAAIIEEKRLRVAADLATAELINGVVSSLGDAFSSALIRFETVAAPEGVSARISISLLSAIADEYNASGVYLDQLPDGTSRAFFDFDTTVMRGIFRSLNGKFQQDMDTGARVTTTEAS